MNIDSIYIELTNQCNFHCATCYNRSGLLPPKHLNWDLLHTFLDMFPAASCSCAGGEPLLYPQRRELLQYIESSPDRSFTLVTNGSLSWILPFYEHVSNLELQVSLDGSCEEINALTRGQGRFAITTSFIRQAASIRPLIGKMVINGTNYQDVEAFYRLIAGFHCLPMFSFVTPSGNAQEHWDSMEIASNDKVRILKQIEDLNAEYHMDSPIPYCTHHCPLLDPDAGLNLLITSDGRIQPCQSLYDPQFSLGTLEDFSSMETRIEQLRTAFLQRLTLDYHCHDCLLRNRCDHGCPALAFQYHKNILDNDEMCDFRKKQFFYLLRSAETKRTLH